MAGLMPENKVTMDYSGILYFFSDYQKDDCVQIQVNTLVLHYSRHRQRKRENLMKLYYLIYYKMFQHVHVIKSACCILYFIKIKNIFQQQNNPKIIIHLVILFFEKICFVIFSWTLCNLHLRLPRLHFGIPCFFSLSH